MSLQQFTKSFQFSWAASPTSFVQNSEVWDFEGYNKSTVQFVVIDGTAVQPSAWNIATSYNTGDEVEYASNYYRALQPTTGDQPDVSPVYWEIMQTTALIYLQRNSVSEKDYNTALGIAGGRADYPSDNTWVNVPSIGTSQTGTFIWTTPVFNIGYNYDITPSKWARVTCQSQGNDSGRGTLNVTLSQ